MPIRDELLVTPPVIARLLGSPWLSLLARIALTTAYWWGGIAKLRDFPGAILEMRHFGLEPPAVLAALTILIELGAPILLIAARAVWLAAGSLAVFTIWATLLAHAFWRFPPPQHFAELNSFLEHIGLVGGLVIAAILSESNAARGRTRRAGP